MASKIDELLTAMHEAGGSRYVTAARWLEYAVWNEKLGAAMHEVFGKKFPSPNTLGARFRDWYGRSIGELVFINRTRSSHHSIDTSDTWGIVPRESLAPKEFEPAPKPMIGLDERRAARAARQAAEEAARLSVNIAVVPEYLTTVTIDREGRAHEEIVRGRDGEPLKARPTAAPAPPASVETKPDPHDKRPPWLQRGELKARDRAEWDAWQKRHQPTVWSDRPVIGFADPGGVVSNNIQRAPAVHDGSNLWNRTLEGL